MITYQYTLFDGVTRSTYRVTFHKPTTYEFAYQWILKMSKVFMVELIDCFCVGEQFRYLIDLVVYEPAAYTEVPIGVPSSMVTLEGALKTGYHTIWAECTEEKMEGFLNWAYRNQSILKVIGHIKHKIE